MLARPGPYVHNRAFIGKSGHFGAGEAKRCNEHTTKYGQLTESASRHDATNRRA
jgi:hypothetical protein